MTPLFTNATVMWRQREIAERDSLINLCYESIREAWIDMNKAVQFERVETPILTPIHLLQGHVDAGFPLIDTNAFTKSQTVLRPETTIGCITAFHSIFPNKNQMLKNMPFCVWQVGKSFREETNPETMRASKLRLREFYQMEFQLFTSATTKADYLTSALTQLTNRFGGIIIEATELPHYSRRTLDWEMDGLELAGCSERTDWEPGIIYEVSIGLDRLLAKTYVEKRANEGDSSEQR